MKPYAPVSCDLHSRYESAVLRAEPLLLRWTDPQSSPAGDIREVVRPLDVRIEDQAEWLIAERQDGQQRAIRLDWIRDIEPLRRD